MTHHENTFNRLLKSSLNHLNREEEYDIIIVHDITLPYIEELSFFNLTLEALRHGVSCMATSEILGQNTLFKLDESIYEESENMSSNFMSPNKYRRSLSTAFGTVLDQMESFNYKIGYKPQAFQHSIFRIIFENVIILFLFINQRIGSFYFTL